MSAIRHVITNSAKRSPVSVAPSPLGDDGRPIINRILIANRGEIACRVIATCRRLNITSIAIYTTEDADSLHVHEADEALCLGSIDKSTTGNPFLDIDTIVKAASQTNAHAIHPGYGYLSENPDFADAIRRAGLVFIGPSSAAMSTLGNKRTSKVYLRENAPDVPLIPGFSGSSQDADALEAAAARIGYPVMLKASSGGGGKGMRIVREAGHLKSELERAQSEAQRSFGDADIILEKYIEAGKHVEIQIVGDRHGKVLSFYERDCSVQRRHQKIIEESPCPWLSPEMRAKMSATAVHVAELIQYEGAGTVEFVVDVTSNSFYFLEVNARLQVEHPITEEVTGWDLVSLQIYAAAGGRFASIPDLTNIKQSGHAIECRLCAEDASKDFLPERGTIELWHPAIPQQCGLDPSDVRFEAAIQTGSEISIHFDSMVAKIIVWAPTRELCMEKMAQVLAKSICAGVRTNQLFLQSCLLHPALRRPDYTTSFVPANLEELLKNPYATESRLLAQLGVVPCLYLRQLRKTLFGSGLPFQHVRQSFRNQKFGSIHEDINIVEISSETTAFNQDLSSKTHVFRWSLQSSSTEALSERGYDVSMIEVPKAEHVGRATTSIAQTVTDRYNTISSTLRDAEKSPVDSRNVAFIGARPIEAQFSTNRSTPSPLSTPRASTIVTTIDGAKVAAHIVIPTQHHKVLNLYSSEKGLPHIMLVHFPTLGTWTTYKIFDLLTYTENLREEAMLEFNERGDSSRIAKAPMPCKVLKVLKAQGDEVKSTETVMVVESMKMEMSISIAQDGKFECYFNEGDAVDEGVVLCKVV